MTERRPSSDDHVWPNFFLVGVPKSASTSIYNYLRQADDIFLPVKDELNFFFAGEYLPNRTAKVKKTSKKRYIEYYRRAGVKNLVGDTSPDYYMDPKNPELIRNCLLYTSPSPRDRQKSRMPSSA